jgi:hypothetical protein
MEEKLNIQKQKLEKITLLPENLSKIWNNEKDEIWESYV